MFNISIKNDVKRMFEIFGKELKMNKELRTFLSNFNCIMLPDIVIVSFRRLELW